MQVLIAPPITPVGSIKSFGPLGPQYEVGPVIRQLDDGDWMVEITMVETGEKTEYRWTRLKREQALMYAVAFDSRCKEALEEAYRFAIRLAAAETGLAKTSFPQQCPWTFEQIMDAGFWPQSL